MDTRYGNIFFSRYLSYQGLRLSASSRTPQTSCAKASARSAILAEPELGQLTRPFLRRLAKTHRPVPSQ